MNATTVQSVVTYDTIVEFANPQLKLFPGMTAYVTIPVDTVQNALKLPNTALRYKPPMSAEEILATYKQYGIEGSEQKRPSDDPLTPGSGTQSNAPSQNPPRIPKTDTAIVWKLGPDNKMEPVKVSIGITDHAYTEITGVLKGDLRQGDDLIIRSVVQKSQTLGGLRR
jgi:HlyD family secretion protein